VIPSGVTNSVLGVVMLSLLPPSSSPPSGLGLLVVFSDHSVTDCPWGVRSTVYDSFGVDASSLLQFSTYPCTFPLALCFYLLCACTSIIVYLKGEMGQNKFWWKSKQISWAFNLYAGLTSV